MIFVIGCSETDVVEQQDCIPKCVQGGGLPRECAKECDVEQEQIIDGTTVQDDCIPKCVQTGKLPRDCAKECEELPEEEQIDTEIPEQTVNLDGLKLVNELVIDPGETRRPFVTVTEDKVYVIYGKNIGDSWDFILKIFDKDLKELSSKTIVTESEYGAPMDVRIGTTKDHVYLFHDTTSDTHVLLGYKFELDDNFEEVASLSEPLASAIRDRDAGVGGELIDDPIVLPTEDKLYVITRYKGAILKNADTIYKVYELDQDLSKIKEFDLDLSSVSDGGARQASVRYYDGYYYMALSTITTSEITGSQAAVDILSPTDVVIVKFDTNWNIIESKTIPGDIEDDADSYLTAFDLDEKYYYLSYKHATFDDGTKFDTPLKVYDMNYNLVASASHEGNGRPYLVVDDNLIYYALGIQDAGPMAKEGPNIPSKLYVYELE